MGVNCRIMLPRFISLDNVATAMAILAGNEFEILPFAKGGRGYVHVNKTDLSITPGSIDMLALCPSITFNVKIPGHAMDKHHVIFHAETLRNEEINVPSYMGREMWDVSQLLPRSCPFWITMGRALIDLFGGYMWDVDYDLSVPPSYTNMNIREDLAWETDKSFFAMQDLLCGIRPITLEETANGKHD